MEHTLQTLTQSGVYRTLAAYLRGGRLSHALLLEGGAAEERLTLARFVAGGALCEEEPSKRPCGQCRHCAKAEKQIHPDILVYGSEGGARSFHIDTVREIRQQAFIRPNEASRKAFLLENVQDMSVQAQNALLKIIEEPPRGVLFVLLCENKSTLLETVLSRVTAFSLDVDGPAAEPAGGEGEHESRAREALLALTGRRELDALEILAAYERDKLGFAALLDALRRLVAGLLVARQEEAGGTQNLQARMSRLQMLSIIAIIDETAAAAALNGNGLLLTTSLCADIRRALE